jgi:hypothetical protein
VTDPSHAVVNFRVQFSEVFGATVCQFLAFDISPKQFGRIQVWCIAGQPFHGQPISLAVQVIRHDAALVSRQAIPDQYDFLTTHSTPEGFEKTNETVRIVVSGPSLKEHAAAASIPSISNSCAN